ncbi:polygalacturonase-like [Phalaenopsis equestris]|uniref:polygalacturonase-like n=1 Tax=Phalaenopsis equestris TaxID=78828 RepID=UPI0009E3E784|nr:polygalacturonase-like [Phalaenopsis equestris]
MILFLSLVILSLQSFFCAAINNFEEELGILNPFSLHGMRAHPGFYEELEGDEGRLLERGFDRISEFQGGSKEKVVNVKDYGAKGEGVDDTKAFLKAWNAACSSNSPVSYIIPKGNTYLLKPITFSGPCKSHISVMIMGTIEASANPSDWSGKNQRLWIYFNEVNNLAVLGGGTINGNGKIWWQKSCKIDKSQPCKDAPTALTFNACNGLRVQSLNVINSQQIHVEFENSKNVMVSNVIINAPGNSPNTDGIHVTRTQNISINHCTIATGDDCISIVSGSQGVHANNIVCGPGHGISIGSLGAKGSTDQVSDVTVDTAQFIGTSNGVRIKTWQGGRGYAKKIVFKNIKMSNVKNPIIIDQNYCDSSKPCTQQKSAVQVSDVQYSNIKGTSASKFAINFNCSRSFPCSGIILEGIDLVKNGGGSAKSFCANVKLTKKGTVIPPPCA